MLSVTVTLPNLPLDGGLSPGDVAR